MVITLSKITCHILLIISSIVSLEKGTKSWKGNKRNSNFPNYLKGTAERKTGDAKSGNDNKKTEKQGQTWSLVSDKLTYGF